MSFLFPDDEERLLYAELWQELLGHVDNKSRVLEVGCGTGEILKALCEKTGCKGIGADPFIVEAHGNPEVISLKGEEIDRLDGKFQVIYTAKSMHHMSDVPKFLKLSRELLDHRGVLLIADWKEGMYRGIDETYHNPIDVMRWIQQAGFSYFEVRVRPTYLFVVATDSPPTAISYEV